MHVEGITEITEAYFEIRPAKLEDIPKLRQFEQGVIAAERPFDPGLREDPVHYYDLDYLVQSSEARLAVIEAGQELLACGYARIERAKPYLSFNRQAYLGFMYTIPEYRGRGLNRLILQDLEQWALSMGVHECRLEVYSGNTPAIRAYSKAGFSHHMIQMRKGLL